MTDLEAYVADSNWVWCRRAFTTVKDGHGFIVYRDRHQMWLAGLTREVTEDQLSTHSTQPPSVAGFWVPYHGSITPRMFEVPATPELVSAVVFSACLGN